jgi:hypothetical protein
LRRESAVIHPLRIQQEELVQEKVKSAQLSFYRLVPVLNAAEKHVVVRTVLYGISGALAILLVANPVCSKGMM